MKAEKEYEWFAKGLLLPSERTTIASQKDSSQTAKGVLSQNCRNLWKMPH